MSIAAPLSQQRRRGAYYTPHNAAELMADWILQPGGGKILEPSMGDGVFLRAMEAIREQRGAEGVEVVGVEVDRRTFRSVLAAGLLPESSAINADFLSVKPFPVAGVIGNPPYVRLRNLPEGKAKTAVRAAARVLGQPMESSGSAWMPFVLHATQFLRSGGRLAMVLPYDLTYVKYARPLWRHLRECFSGLRLVRVRERIFDDVLQEVVLLFADGFGGATDFVEFETYETIDDLVGGVAGTRAPIAVGEIEAGDRPFMEALLPRELRTLLHNGLGAKTVTIGDIGPFNIGYVTGDKNFFHPSDEEAASFELPSSTLRPAVTSTRQIRGSGLFTSGIVPSEQSHLFVPDPEKVTPGVRRYIEHGEDAGVDDRYKCKIRSPWYVVPGLKEPDLIVSVFSEYPCMLVNDSGLLASNSLLCGYLPPAVDPRAIVAAWYTPLTALHAELQIHALGGGVFVLVPGEISRIRIPALDRSDLPLDRLDALLKEGDFEGASVWGRDEVLRKQLDLPSETIDLIEQGREVLAGWRKSK